MSDLENEYRQRFETVLVPLAAAVEKHLKDTLQGEVRIDRITARAKSVNRFLEKTKATEGGQPKYSEPFQQIQDQIGARVVTYYLADVDRIAGIIERYYRRVESRIVVPDSESEFDYFGRHYILLIPTDLIPSGPEKSLAPEFFELQISTLFQHAWAEANHDLGYKPQSATLTRDAKRRIAYTSAQAWGADRMFDELFRELAGNSSHVAGRR
jgi:ppGpp synthetase/RelA/SpoT-type nucleotidyltranferase